MRETFGSRIGFILVSAGCAIGIGNVWKFPYIAGENGGGVFVLVYLFFLVVMAVPVLTMELAVGRASKKSAVGAYKALEKPGTRWHLHGYICFAGCLLLMMYYTTVSGWMLNYFVRFLTGAFPAGTDVTEAFTGMLGDPVQMLGYMALTVLLGVLVCIGGVEKSLERITRVMMTCLLVLIVVLAVHSITLPGASGGLAFYLLPDWEKAKEIGFGHVVVAAMNQSFFTMSLGVAAMEIFGSYMPDTYSLGGEAMRIGALDTFVALVAGLIIFPACFSFGIEPDSGPALIFMTLPRVFMNMSYGRLWGSLFFLFMTFASFSTVTAVFENLIAFLMEHLGLARKKAGFVCFLMVLIGSIPCALGYNVLSSLRFVGGRFDVLDFEDFIVSGLLLPLGSLIFLLFCVSRRGWGLESYLQEANKGEGAKISPKLGWYLRFVLPVMIVVILVQGLVDIFLK